MCLLVSWDKEFEATKHSDNDKDRIDWRRSKVQELSSKGYSQRAIPHTLQVGLATVNRDISYLRNQEKTKLKKH
jgi:Trp operon repressor